jgi:hypothetical protein
MWHITVLDNFLHTAQYQSQCCAVNIWQGVALTFCPCGVDFLSLSTSPWRSTLHSLHHQWHDKL